jgi:outer membrane protein assembly factor BamB
MKKFFQVFLRGMTRWYVILPVVLLVLGWRAVDRLTPQIVSIPAPQAGETLLVEGKAFGLRQGASTISALDETGQPFSVEVLVWSTKQIQLAAPAQPGSLQITRKLGPVSLQSQSVPFTLRLASLPSQPYGYKVPVQADSPWPSFRRDHRNTANSPLPAIYNGDQPWMFQTGKGIFSTPVIDRNGVVYVGSADHQFYALNPDGSQNWSFKTGEIIDSAGILLQSDPQTGKEVIMVPSGDGYLYTLDLDPSLGSSAGRLIRTFDARVSPRASYNNWFEGNIQAGFDGTIYAGNTNFNYYAIRPDGSLKWTYETGSNNWSNAAIADDGTIFWGSNDTYIRAVDLQGKEKWNSMTLGFIAASAAIGSDGTVYIGSFDSYLYALDPHTGKVLWKFKTNDHIYASVALGHDALGQTDAIYFGSTDGVFYALNPDGSLKWRFDVGDPIRSSAVLGGGPQGEPGAIVYFGAGNGQIYALNTQDGSRRWSFNTTADDDVLRDRNDMNGSPALSPTGLVIGGEHGRIWYLPYDYCLQVDDARCDTRPGSGLPDEMASLLYVTPGGSVEKDMPQNLPLSTMITLKLVVRQNGQTLDARLCSNPLGCPQRSLVVTADPAFDFEIQKSADGQYLYIRPIGFLQPDTQYTLHVQGDTYTGGLAIGNLTIGGRKTGSFDQQLSVRTQPAGARMIPLKVESERVSAVEWTRLAVPIPPMMPSLNQIGFDYMDWIMGTVEVSQPDENGKGRFILWVIGGKRDESGRLVADPQSDFTLPLSGVYQGDSFMLINREVLIPVTGIPILFNYFEMRGQLLPDLRAAPQTTLYADTDVMKIPTFGPYLVVAGLANNVYEKLIVSATYLMHPYDESGQANLRPQGVEVDGWSYTPASEKQAGSVSVSVRLEPGTSYPLELHRPGILLVDEALGEAVYLNYLENLNSQSDGNGSLSSVTLTLPAGTKLSQTTKAWLMLDVFPLESVMLDGLN